MSDHLNTVECPACGEVIFFDSANDLIVCEGCGALVVIEYEEENYDEQRN